MTVNKSFYFIEHNIAYSAVGSHDVEETKFIFFQSLLNVSNVRQMFHQSVLITKLAYEVIKYVSDKQIGSLCF